MSPRLHVRNRGAQPQKRGQIRNINSTVRLRLTGDMWSRTAHFWLGVQLNYFYEKTTLEFILRKKDEDVFKYLAMKIFAEAL